MNPRRKKRLAIVSSILIGVAAVAGLSLYALNENFDLFFTPTEVINGKEESGIMPVVGQRIRVGGMVVVGSVKRDSESLKVAFKLKDSGTETITIKYDKILPDLFREGQGIVAQGILIDKNTLEASEVLAKHDEEYMPKEVAEAMGKEHNKPTY
ncbi:cytochrome c maturation protein CcmE [Thalassomonas sp. M1454]|uniref:cytochrome c maturation protein CcmE n=1 Tax=Thalassomonas sp. M1454 TaxID=2594477 RepID=UPI00117E9587|nr:cytochrome c maturation protein CcmE [Thalassomonas sp. M1454]TRX54020.1 cytochrome c maturation protein CcmE [Thalassomonas sp. M1454]